ncbi:hypothetical protein [Hyperthermus butylicus]|uniref:hypothetical protein n=1 Tax=Hyperthermus butylicus TaxID=54248 RepID=UPI00064E8803|nr:hypothetical protein [Hyperthermus butylicus]
MYVYIEIFESNAKKACSELLGFPGSAVTVGKVLVQPLLVDVLLRASGLPTSREVEELVSKAEPVEVIVSRCDEGNVAAKGCKLVRLLFDGYPVRLREGRVETPTAGFDVPPPSIAIGGRLGFRYRFHGLPEEILAPMLLLVTAAAGGAWKPKSCAGLDAARGRMLLYAVPGAPCARAIAASLQVVYCSDAAEIDVVNIDTLNLLGKKPPVDKVPSFRLPSGKLHIGVPPTPEKLAAIWR